MKPHGIVRENVREMEPHGSLAATQMKLRENVHDNEIEVLKQLIKTQACREVVRSPVATDPLIGRRDLLFATSISATRQRRDRGFPRHQGEPDHASNSAARQRRDHGLPRHRGGPDRAGNSGALAQKPGNGEIIAFPASGPCIHGTTTCG